MLEAGDAKLDDGVVVRLARLHPNARADEIVTSAASGNAASLKDKQFAVLHALHRDKDLELPWIGPLPGHLVDVPFALVHLAQLFPWRRIVPLEDRAHPALGRIALAHELDPSGLDLVVDDAKGGALLDFLIVACLTEHAVFRELEKGSGHSPRRGWPSKPPPARFRWLPRPLLMPAQ